MFYTTTWNLGKTLLHSTQKSNDISPIGGIALSEDFFFFDHRSKIKNPLSNRYFFPIGKRASPKFQVVVSFSDFTLVDDRFTALHTVHQKIGVTFEMYWAAEQAMRVIFDGWYNGSVMTRQQNQSNNVKLETCLATIPPGCAYCKGLLFWNLWF